MRHSIYLIACLLSLATALALLGVGASLITWAPTTPSDTDAANVGVVDRFYDAANAVLRTGNATALETVVAPAFVDHLTLAGVVPDRDGLTQTLLARYATFPDLRLVVEDMVAGGDRVAVRVHAEGTATGMFLGLALPAAAGIWGPLEIFRIADGVIAERWGSGSYQVLAEPLGRAPLAAENAAVVPRLVALTRLVYASYGTSRIANGSATRVLVVGAGTLRVTVDPTPPSPGGSTPPSRLVRRHGTMEAIPAGQTATLTQGDALSTPPGAGYATGNGGNDTAIILVATVDGDAATTSPEAGPSWATATPLLPAAAEGSSSSSGVVADVLSADLAMTVPAGTELMVGRVILRPGGDLPLVATTGPVLVVVDAGSLTLATSGGIVLSRPVDGPIAMSPDVLLAAGDAATLTTGTGAIWRAGDDGPAELLVLTIMPSP